MEKPRYVVADINKIINGALISSHDPDAEIKEIAIDSRRLSVIDNTIFFALVTSRNDGHKYIKQCYQFGIRNYVVSIYPEDLDEMADTNIILVKDTLKALQLLATSHRKNFNIPVIGITGSNGKTIVKEWIYQILFDRNNVVRSPKSYNSKIGVP